MNALNRSYGLDKRITNHYIISMTNLSHTIALYNVSLYIQLLDGVAYSDMRLQAHIRIRTDFLKLRDVRLDGEPEDREI